MAESLSARAIIRISAIPDTGLNRALTGTVEATRRAQRRIVDDSARAQRDRERLEQKQATAAMRESKRAETAARREAEETARYKQRVAEQGARLQIAMNNAARREAEKTARTQIREAQRVLREEQRVSVQIRDARRAYAAGIGGAVLGAASGAVNLLQRGQGLAGVGSLEERLQVAGQFRQQLIRTGGEAGLTTEERQRAEEKIRDVSVKTNQSLMGLAEGLATAQERFPGFLRAVIGNLEEVATAATATGTPFLDLIGVLGTATQAFQLDAAGQREFLDILVSSSAKGAIKVGEFSREMAPTMGGFALQTKRRGIEGAREFLALGQTVGGASQAGAAETATMVRDLVGRLALPAVQKDLRTAGIEVVGDDGRLKDLGEIGALFAGSEQFQKAGVRKTIFTDLQARSGAEFLMQAIRRDPNAFRGISDIRTGEGQQIVSSQIDALRSDPSFKLAGVGVQAQADTAKDMDRLLTAMTPAVTAFTELQTKYPLLTESFSVLKQTVIGLTAALIANRVAFGSLARGTRTTSGSLVDMNGSILETVKGKGGLITSIGAAGAALVQAGATFTIAYQGTRMLLDELGITEEKQQTAGSYLYDLIHGETPKVFERGMGSGAGGSAGSLEPVALGESLRLANEDLDAMADKLAEANRKDPATVTVKVEDGRSYVSKVEHGDGLAVAPYTGSQLGP